MSDLQAGIEALKTSGSSKPRLGRFPVNQPMVEHWLDAIGDKNPIYVDEAAAVAAGHPGVVAPPAMIQVWTMVGLGGVRPDDDPLGKIIELFDAAGYVGVVATNCEQTYHRYLEPGEQVSIRTPAQQAGGEGGGILTDWLVEAARHAGEFIALGDDGRHAGKVGEFHARSNSRRLRGSIW